MLGRWDGTRFELKDLHRFENIPLQTGEHLFWNITMLWAEIKVGLSHYTSLYSEPLVSLGVDSWAVDYGLLGNTGNLLGNPYHYRDHRTDGIPEQVFQKISVEQIFNRTGIQFLPFNTLYQLYSQQHSAERAQLDEA